MKSKCWSRKLAETALFSESTEQEAGEGGAGESEKLFPWAESAVGKSAFTIAGAETNCIQACGL